MRWGIVRDEEGWCGFVGVRDRMGDRERERDRERDRDRDRRPVLLA